MRGWAFGLLRLSRQDFYDMTQGEFWEAMAAYRNEKTSDRRHTGELARGLGARIVNHLIKKPYKKVEVFWEMPWDKGNTAEDIAAELQSMSSDKRRELARQYKEQTDKYFNDGIGNNSSEP